MRMKYNIDSKNQTVYAICEPDSIVQGVDDLTLLAIDVECNEGKRSIVKDMNTDTIVTKAKAVNGDEYVPEIGTQVARDKALVKFYLREMDKIDRVTNNLYNLIMKFLKLRECYCRKVARAQERLNSI